MSRVSHSTDFYMHSDFFWCKGLRLTLAGFLPLWPFLNQQYCSSLKCKKMSNHSFRSSVNNIYFITGCITSLICPDTMCCLVSPVCFMVDWISAALWIGLWCLLKRKQIICILSLLSFSFLLPLNYTHGRQEDLK